MDDLENLRIACLLVNARKYAEIETVEKNQENFNFRRELLIRASLTHSINFEKDMFYKNAIALDQDPQRFLTKLYAPDFPTLRNLDEQLKYWQKANSRLFERYV